MTVAELIEKLKEMPKDYPVLAYDLTAACDVQLVRFIQDRDCVYIEVAQLPDKRWHAPRATLACDKIG